MIYHRREIERIAHIAFQAVQERSGRLCSVDKVDVLISSVLWRKVFTELAGQYPKVQLTHMYVDNAVMQLVRNPRQFDVLVTENTFGDILTDEMAMVCGSLDTLPSASLGARGEQTFGLYEPSGGSAPDIADKGIANPIAQILSMAMMLRFSLREIAAADAVEYAVRSVISDGFRTKDLATGAANERIVTTAEMRGAIAAALMRCLFSSLTSGLASSLSAGVLALSYTIFVQTINLLPSFSPFGALIFVRLRLCGNDFRALTLHDGK